MLKYIDDFNFKKIMTYNKNKIKLKLADSIFNIKPNNNSENDEYYIDNIYRYIKTLNCFIFNKNVI